VRYLRPCSAATRFDDSTNSSQLIAELPQPLPLGQRCRVLQSMHPDSRFLANIALGVNDCSVGRDPVTFRNRRRRGNF